MIMIITLFWFFCLTSIELSLPLLLNHRHFQMRGEIYGLGFLGNSLGQVIGLLSIFFLPLDFIFQWANFAILLYLFGTIITTYIFFSLHQKPELDYKFAVIQPENPKDIFIKSLILSLLNPILFLSNSDFILIAINYIQEFNIPIFVTVFFIVSLNFLFNISIALILRKSMKPLSSWKCGRILNQIGKCIGILGVLNCSWHFLFHYPLDFLPTFTSTPIQMEDLRVSNAELSSLLPSREAFAPQTVLLKGQSQGQEWYGLNYEHMNQFLEPDIFGQRKFGAVDSGIINRDTHFLPSVNKYWPVEKFRKKRKQRWYFSSKKKFNAQFDNHPVNQCESFLTANIRDNAIPISLRSNEANAYETYWNWRLQPYINKLNEKKLTNVSFANVAKPKVNGKINQNQGKSRLSISGKAHSFARVIVPGE